MLDAPRYSRCATWTRRSAAMISTGLYRWFRQGRLNRSQGMVHKRFPKVPTPKAVAKLIRRGILENARFAAAVLVRGIKDDQPLLVRWDASFPTLYQIRQRGMISTPISYATAHMARPIREKFPPRFGGRDQPVGAAAGETSRDPRGREVAGYPAGVEDHEVKKRRRRRVLKRICQRL